MGFNRGGVNLRQVYQSIAKEIYNQIKSDILKLKIEDGDFLTLSELAEKYNVSKTPVRDALGALEIEGYLTSMPRKGYLVKPVTKKSIKEAFQMRLILERSAASLAIKAAGDEELERILQLAMEFPESLKKGQNDEFDDLNDTFHMLIVKASHNSLLIETCVGVMENLSRILRNDSKNLEFSNEKEEHINIAKALVERDSKKAEELISEHILHLETRIYSNQMDV